MESSIEERVGVRVEGGRVDLASVSFEDLVAEMIRRLGDDPTREGMVRTPERVRESLEFLTQGYRQTAADAVSDALFEERHKNMVLVKDIEMYSMCEHHLLPFFGKVHVAYIPDGRIMGLSKTARIVEVFSRRFQVQERLTEQIAQAIWDTIRPLGAAVVMEAYHLCMMMRGVQKQNSKTITSAMRGTFLKDPRTRDEFLRLVTSEHRPL
ncbi:MAG: GTP cyclohydrolase I FolE [Gemmatimonadetes bacterium]|nr:GTP cyclohydrolase I FolE [Gemmatimonadota bacterium]